MPHLVKKGSLTTCKTTINACKMLRTALKARYREFGGLVQSDSAQHLYVDVLLHGLESHSIGFSVDLPCICTLE